MGAGALRFSVLVFLGLVSLSAAQEACTTATRVLDSAEKIKNFKCATFSGTLVVQSVTLTANPGTPVPSIVLESLGEIQGGNLEFSDIHINDEFSSNVASQDPTRGPGEPGLDSAFFGISAPNLAVIDQSLIFNTLTNLTMPSFQLLNKADEVSFSNVHFLNETQFGTDSFGLLTSLGSLSFINTNVATIGPLSEALGASDAAFTATDNSKLTSIELPGFSADNDHMVINIKNNILHPSVSFPALWGGSVTLSGVKSFDAPNLHQLGLPGRNTLQSINANTLSKLRLESLAKIYGVLEIEENNDLHTIDFPALTYANNLQIRSNSKLRTVMIDPTTPTGVTGNITVDSSGSISCNSLNQSLSNANVACPTSSTQFTTTSSPSSEPSSGSGSSGLSTGAKAGIGVGVGVGALLIAGVLIFFCCRRRRDKSYSSREISAEPYSKSQHSYTESEMAYSKVPHHADTGAGVSEPHSEEHTPTSALADNWSPPERDTPPARDRIELEERQGMRHEMDARSLPDMDSEDDEEADTRSLEDIERIHRER